MMFFIMFQFLPVLICVNFVFGGEEKVVKCPFPSDDELKKMRATFQEKLWKLNPSPYFSDNEEYSDLGELEPPPKRDMLKIAQNRTNYIQKLKTKFLQSFKKRPMVHWLTRSFTKLHEDYIQSMNSTQEKRHIREYTDMMTANYRVFLNAYVNFLNNRNNLIIKQLERSPQGETQESKYWEMMWEILNGPLWKYY